jgi:hypothetical protein
VPIQVSRPSSGLFRSQSVPMADKESESAQVAARYVRKGKRLVVRQHGRIARLRALGCSTLDAELMLDVFVYTLKIFEDSERRLRDLG